MTAELTFAAGALQRAPELRQAERLAVARAAPDARAVVVGGAQSVLLTSAGTLARVAAHEGDSVLLGLETGGGALFARDEERGPAPAGLRFGALRESAAELAPSEAALAAYAVSLISWHRTQRHCGRCGTATVAAQAGHRRDCPACGLHHFPRTDPVITMVIEAGDRALLTRRHGAPAGRWSAVAGFVDPGETPEAAVVREAREEVGVEVDGVRYVGAQPWPFPHALMLGYRAFAATPPTAARVHAPDELLDARWFTRAELQAALERGEAGLPPPISIGHWLISRWLRRWPDGA